jgi:hypothetical protein
MRESDDSERFSGGHDPKEAMRMGVQRTEAHYMAGSDIEQLF